MILELPTLSTSDWDYPANGLGNLNIPELRGRTMSQISGRASRWIMNDGEIRGHREPPLKGGSKEFQSNVVRIPARERRAVASVDDPTIADAQF